MSQTILQRDPTEPSSAKPRKITVKFLVLALALVLVGAGAFVGYRLYNQSYADVGKSSGLAWPSGVHAANELGPHIQFGNWRGRPIDVISTFTNRDGWSGLIGAQPYLGWHKPFYQNKNNVYVISQPFYPSGQGNNAACAAGSYDNNWKQFGQTLVNNGLNHPNTIIRIAWEFNGDFTYYRPAVPVNPTAANVQQAFAEWRKCWQNVSKSIKATAPNIRTEWPLNSRGSLAYPLSRTGSRLVYNAYDLYPGDQYVDIVGTNDYDHYPPANLNDAQWEARCNQPMGSGSCDVAKFARSHGKKFAVGEWAIKTCGGSSGGDNAMHIRKMKELFNANRDIMAYESYYDDPGVGNACSALMRVNGNGVTATKSAAEYKKWFGAPSPCLASNNQCGPINPSYPQASNTTPTPPPTTPPAGPSSNNNRLIFGPDNRMYYSRDNKKSYIGNSPQANCVKVRRGTGEPRKVTASVINALTTGTEGYCYYEQEPGLNFVREDGTNPVWLVQPGGTKLHVGVLCVPDFMTTQHKKFRLHIVPYGETAGHRQVGTFIGDPQRCGTIN